MSRKTIRLGSNGPDVAEWQRIVGVTPDGVFGTKTEAATKIWQASKSLIPDGIVGPKSWGAAGTATESSTSPSTYIPYVPAKNQTPANRSTEINLIVIHTMEAPEMGSTAENVAQFFANQPRHGALDPKWCQKDANGNLKPWAGASAHYNIDVDSIVCSVYEKDQAWHASNVNGRSIGLEHAGYAKQTAEEWKDPYSTAMLLRSAKFAASLCLKYGIPPVKLEPWEVKAGHAGFCGHVDITTAWQHKNGHVDPGPNFPWDWYLDQVSGFVYPPTSEVSAPESDWVEVECKGERWLVAPSYIAPVGIGEAESIAKQRGCQLPSRELVDAIWKAADLKVDGATLVRKDFLTWSQAEMDAASVHEDQAKRVLEAIADRPYRLVAGTYKDVIRTTYGKLALYGWHRTDGTPVQPVFTGHAPTWRDYSQGLRLVRKIG